MSEDKSRRGTTATLSTFTFSQADFLKLPDRQQEFALVMAQVHDDLRHAMNLFRRELNGLTDFDPGSPETSIVLHQYILSARILYGWTYEAWLVIAEYWHGLVRKSYPRNTGKPAEWVDTGLGLNTSLDSRISVEGKRAGDEIRSYFTAENFIKKIRDKFSFHYDGDKIRAEFAHLDEHDRHEFVAGEQRTNAFYSFTERIRSSAIVRTFGGEDAEHDVRRLFSEVMSPWALIQDFCHDAIFAILSQCNLRGRKFESRAVANPTQVRPIIFIDEDVIEGEADLAAKRQGK